MKTLLVLAIGWAALVPEAQEDGRQPLTLCGTLRHHKDLEGGVWTLTVGKTVYDLHGDLKGFADGDKVEIKGVVEKDKVCFHMVGIVFRLQSIQRKGTSPSPRNSAEVYSCK